MMIITSCSNRPYIVIENKSNKEIRLEFIFDTLDIVNEFILPNAFSQKGYYNVNDPQHSDFKDSIKQTLTNNASILKYFYDKMLLYSIMPGNISNLNCIKPNDENDLKSKPFVTDGSQKIISYYGYDSTLIKKIINNYTITILIPPYYSFYNQCHSCGDCSCISDDAFPQTNELKIVFGSDDFISMTPNSYKRIMKKTKFNSQSDSYIYTITEDDNK